MAHSIELAKRRYSQELAAYTLEQWNIARRALESAGSAGDSEQNADTPQRHTEGSTTESQDGAPVKSNDFAARSSKPTANNHA